MHASHPTAAVSWHWFYTHKFLFLFSFFPLISNCAGQLRLQHRRHLYLPSCACRRAGYPTRLPPPPRCFDTNAISTLPHPPPPCRMHPRRHKRRHSTPPPPPSLKHTSRRRHLVASTLTATTAATRYCHHPVPRTPAPAATPHPPCCYRHNCFHPAAPSCILPVLIVALCSSFM